MAVRAEECQAVSPVAAVAVDTPTAGNAIVAAVVVVADGAIATPMSERPRHRTSPTTANRASSTRFEACLEMSPNGSAFSAILRPTSCAAPDPFVPGTMIDKFRLHEGVLINGMVSEVANGGAPGSKKSSMSTA